MGIAESRADVHLISFLFAIVQQFRAENYLLSNRIIISFFCWFTVLLFGQKFIEIPCHPLRSRLAEYVQHVEYAPNIMTMENSPKVKIKPMGIGVSLLLFGIPSLIFSFSIYYIMPKLHQNGIKDFDNFIVSMTTPLALMLLASIIAYKVDGNCFNWPAFLTRFRLKKMTREDWIYAILLFIAMVIIYGTLSFTSKWLIQFKLFAPPEFLIPAVDPRLEQNILVHSFMGIALKGQWWIAIVYFIFLLFNIVGEELWWRGYIFPRQELAFKKWTWVIHGILWGLFHVFWKWNLIILLPSCLALSYVIYKRKNTWIGIITHMAFNSVPLIGIIIGIIG